MNFAQLIDPEWVMDGAKERFKRRRAMSDEMALLAKAKALGRVVVAPEMAPPPREALPSPISAQAAMSEARRHLVKLQKRRVAEAAERAQRSGRVNGLKGRSHALLALLAQCPEGLTARQVRDYTGEQAPDEDPRWVYAMLTNLCNSRVVYTQVFNSGAVYHITDKGRERVVPEAARWTREG